MIMEPEIPKIRFVNKISFCFCNKCEKKICPVKYDISKADFISMMEGEDLPLICEECKKLDISQ